MKFHNTNGKSKPKLDEYFHMYPCQLNFALFSATSALGITWQHLNHPNLLVGAVYRFHVYFHVRLILHDLGAHLPHDGGFSEVRNAFIKNSYNSICNDYVVNPDKTWLHGNWFYTKSYAVFTSELKAAKRSPPDEFGRRIIRRYEKRY